MEETGLQLSILTELLELWNNLWLRLYFVSTLGIVPVHELIVSG